MKKLWWLLPVALLAAGSLLFFGCGGGDDDDDDDDEGWTMELPAGTTLALERNGYGDGYQGFAPATIFPRNFPGFKAGEEYTLKLKFTASRDVKNDDKNKKRIGIGLVDRSPTAPAWSRTEWPEDWEGGADTNYWTKLSKGDDLEKGVFYTEDITSTTTVYEVEAVFPIIGNASGSAVSGSNTPNTIFFQTEEVPTTPGTNNGNNTDDFGKITLTFSEFIFIKGDGGEGFEPPPPPLEIKFAAAAAEGKTVINAVGGTLSDVTDAGFTFTKTADYQGSHAWFKVDFGSGKKLSDYEAVTLHFEGVSGDITYKNLVILASKTELTTAYSTDADIETVRLNEAAYNDWNSGGDGTSTTDSWDIGPSLGATGAAQDVELVFDTGNVPKGTRHDTACPTTKDRVTPLDGQVVYFGIHLPGTKDDGTDDTLFKISDVKIIPKSE